MSPTSIPSIKHAIRGLSVADAERELQHALELEEPASIRQYLSSRLEGEL